MSSGTENQFERFTKLLASLTTLTTTGKRNPEAVNNVLQAIVFGKQKKQPKAKVWPRIVELWKRSSSNRNIALTLATLNMKLVESADPRTLSLIEAYPECFGPEEVRCPIPISLILSLAALEGVSKGSEWNHSWVEKTKEGVEHCCSIAKNPHTGEGGILEMLGIPYTKLRTAKPDFEDDPIPVAPGYYLHKVGQTLRYGQDYVVLENNRGANLLFIALMSHVDIERNDVP
jgi:hypothetical protein